MSDLSSIGLVIDSWEEARTVPDFEERLGALIFRHFFELAPRTKTHFGVRRNFDPTLENLRKNGVALQHIKRMIRFIHLMLYMEGPPELLYQLLEDLGRRHLKYNSQPQMVPLMGQAFIQAMESYLGPEMWNEKVESAWESIFDLIENRMTAGMSKK